jgi:Mg-chelatase subunit ChlD
MKVLTIRSIIALFIVGIGIGVAQAWFSRSPAPNPPVDEPPPTETGNDATPNSALEMVFVLDTTGSMGGLLEGAKQRIWGIVNEVMQTSSRPAVRVGLVAYRDRGDEYVTRILPVTSDLDQVYSTLMEYRADGGGDGPENVRRALAEAVRNAGWSARSNGTVQIIFLVGDAPPHEDYQDEPSTATTTQEAVKSGMIVNTIQCGNMSGTQEVWQSIARHGEGQYFSIAQDGGVQAIATPYDRELSELGTRIGTTFVPYGGGGGAAGERYRATARARQAAVESVAASAPVTAAADRAENKALNKEAYKGDLLTSLENGTVKLDVVKDEDLPDDLKKLSLPERQKEIDKRLAERKQLRDDILKLSKQRDEFIAAERKKRSGKPNSFDSAVSAALRAQLVRKGIK